MDLAVIIIARNEELNIADCIRSAEFADEVVVIDSGSTDCTGEIARSLGAKVIIHPMREGFGQQRNFALEQTKALWAMFIDADERISPELATEIRSKILGEPNCAYQVPMQNVIFNKPLLSNRLRPSYKTRLVPRSQLTYHGFVHERAVTLLPSKKLSGRLIHYPYASWDHYCRKMNLYSTMMAHKLYTEGKQANLCDIFVKPFWAFIQHYFLKLGLVDGKLGFILAVFHAYYYTFAKYVKLIYYKNTQDEYKYY